MKDELLNTEYESNRTDRSGADEAPIVQTGRRHSQKPPFRIRSGGGVLFVITELSYVHILCGARGSIVG
jgi:hypothetical protein